MEIHFNKKKKEGSHLGDPGADGSIIIKMLRKQCEIVDWIHLSHDTDQ
jgi:hypothetical protein